MNFAGRYFLDFAREVQASAWPRGGCTMAAERSIISRAYYAVFWAARETIVRRGQTISDGAGAHQEVINVFEDWAERDPTCAEIADALISLRRDRNRADYEPIANITGEIPFVLESARRLLDRLKGLG